MWLLPALFLLIIQGHFSTCQKYKVRGTYGSTLRVSWVYSPELESYGKFWCRGNDRDCHKILVKTSGSEQPVKKGRASIQDDHSRHTFTTTLESLQWDDEDTYWCGIEQTGADIRVEFSVIVVPVTTQCHYRPEWETYVKSWCQDADSNGCIIFVETPGSDLPKTRVSINQKKRTFSMTILEE